MMHRTHLVFALLVALIILPFIQDKLLFTVLFFAATILPDIDSATSFITKKTNKIDPAPDLSISKHRGIFHSMTFCLALSLPFLFFIPSIALPIFFGYTLHLMLDSFTIDGVRFWWPSKKSSQGPVRTGSIMENVLFIIVIFICIILILPLKILSKLF
ncbi:hypothetical protein COS75_01945 [Candidatus Pacearchaeota archaeon CG06_land_8_20_14_3_00_35_12]|nr:MAG: hypothetical protein COS75_01945 [Candidatus Pacearchaeota archaeon CG06_land_8_20_14_3_00_35_12]